MLKYISGRQYPVVPAAVHLNEQEYLITPFTVPNINPSDQIEVDLEIVWGKPEGEDLGEIEIIMRRDSLAGPVVFQTDESCYFHATSRVQFQEQGVNTADALYYLIVRSYDNRAVLNGPVFITCRVFDEQTIDLA